jgi:hypothetical protein
MAWEGNDFFNLLKTISLDLMETYDRLRTDADDHFSRRNWVRTFCSQVDAFAYSTKQMLASMAEFPGVTLTPHEVVLLREEAYEIGNNGEVKLRGDRFVPIRTNLRFVAKICSRAFGISYELDTGGPGWNALDDAFTIRNRLVHPKAFQDMYVTDDELKIVGLAQDWFQKLHLDLWKLISDGLKGVKR